ncbi:hypothetical protein [Actinokineospora diospyrosa]|uniref:SPFH domain/Band 7 family protein n=1 Tax=Actinokineospora diospyrosa TaxID=103728 RepID=A0ABT1IN66_9PSEU|nr:hypothetical protein [Actinokineospora diospyrosa]MCP2273906.1 hypothetical protein [Actinokineospora diospyrosa]
MADETAEPDPTAGGGPPDPATRWHGLTPPWQAPIKRASAAGSGPDDPVVRPIKINRAVRGGSLPTSSDHTVIVSVTKDGQYEIVRGRLKMSAMVSSLLWEVFSVNVSAQEDTFTLDLPTRLEAFAFAAEVTVRWRVVDPEAAVRAQAKAPRAAIRQRLEPVLRGLSRGFDLRSSAAAEHHINNTHMDRAFTVPGGIAVEGYHVRLDLDEEARAHLAEQERHVWQREKLHAQQETNAVAHQLNKQQAKFEADLAAMRAQHELDLRMERMSVYADALRTDSNNMLALRLSGHHEDVNEVIELMMRERRMEFEGASALLNSLLERNLVNRKDVEAIMANASRSVIEKLRGDRAVTGREAHNALPVGAGNDEEEDEDGSWSR